MMEASGPLNGTVAELLGSPRWSSELAGPASDIETDAAGRELGVVFPGSYNDFLRCFEAARVRPLELFSLPQNGLRDVVLMNQLAAPPLPPPWVMVGRDNKGGVYCLDTSSRDAEGECPIHVLHRGEPASGSPPPSSISWFA